MESLFYTHGTYSAFYKLGYGPEQARAVLTAAKPYVLPKAGRKQHSAVLADMFREQMGAPKHVAQQLANTPTMAMSMKENTKAFKPVADLQDTLLAKTPASMPETRLRIKEDISTLDPHANTPSGALQRDLAEFVPPGQRGVINPGKGDHSAQIRDLSETLGRDAEPFSNMTGEQRMMFNSIIRGHEMDELLTQPSAIMRRRGHKSPRVILREHNRRVTLPEGDKIVSDAMTPLRGAESVDFAKYLPEGLGQGERVSRHAQKRISELMEKDFVDEMTRDYGLNNLTSKI